MARTAGQMPRGLASFDLGALVHAVIPPLRADRLLGVGLSQGDEITAQAVACSGLAALLGLPILLLASVVLGAPLAAPAAIALGYLAMSYALVSDHPRSAAVINTIVLVGLVAWSLGLLLVGEELSRGALAAALLAPAFAAAPALARIAIAPRRDRAVSIARRNTTCLDQMAPGQAVLVVRRDGTLLAATQAACTELSIPADPSGDVGHYISLVDRPKLSDAIASCQLGAPAVEVMLQGVGAAGVAGAGFAAEVSGSEGETVSIRLRTVEPHSPAVEAPPEAPCETASLSADRSGPACDLGEAADFAVRHVEQITRSKDVALTSAVEEGVTTACERQICRRIFVLMIEGALTGSHPGDALHLTGRAMRGVALLRVVHVPVSSNGQISDFDQQSNFRALRELVDRSGGTLVIGGPADEMHISVRLDLAKPICNGNEEGKR
jgi:hypothetical protein